MAEAGGLEEDGDKLFLDIKVYGNDIEKALKALKRQIQKEGLFKEIKKRSFYEKPSEKEKRKQREARKKDKGSKIQTTTLKGFRSIFIIPQFSDKHTILLAP